MTSLERIEQLLETLFQEIKQQPNPAETVHDILTLLPGLFEEVFLPERIDQGQMSEVMRILRDRAGDPDK